MTTKRQQIEALLKEKLDYIEIVKQTASSYKYVANIARNLKRPGVLKKSEQKYRDSEKGRQRLRRQVKRWRKRHPEKLAGQKKRVLNLHQQLTLPVARNRYQHWTIRELEYLERHGKEKTTHQLALDLGRSFASVATVAARHGIDLRGDKVGASTIRFIGIHKDPKLTETKVVQV